MDANVHVEVGINFSIIGAEPSVFSVAIEKLKN
jgi:hypothetical protein